jgi:hypothetical protein
MQHFFALFTVFVCRVRSKVIGTVIYGMKNKSTICVRWYKTRTMQHFKATIFDPKA